MHYIIYSVDVQLFKISIERYLVKALGEHCLESRGLIVSLFVRARVRHASAPRPTDPTYGSAVGERSNTQIQPSRPFRNQFV